MWSAPPAVEATLEALSALENVRTVGWAAAARAHHSAMLYAEVLTPITRQVEELWKAQQALLGPLHDAFSTHAAAINSVLAGVREHVHVILSAGVNLEAFAAAVRQAAALEADVPDVLETEPTSQMVAIGKILLQIGGAAGGSVESYRLVEEHGMQLVALAVLAAIALFPLLLVVTADPGRLRPTRP